MTRTRRCTMVTMMRPTPHQRAGRRPRRRPRSSRERWSLPTRAPAKTTQAGLRRQFLSREVDTAASPMVWTSGPVHVPPTRRCFFGPSALCADANVPCHLAPYIGHTMAARAGQSTPLFSPHRAPPLAPHLLQEGRTPTTRCACKLLACSMYLELCEAPDGSPASSLATATAWPASDPFGPSPRRASNHRVPRTVAHFRPHMPAARYSSCCPLVWLCTCLQRRMATANDSGENKKKKQKGELI